MGYDNSHLRVMLGNDGAAVLDTQRGMISTLNATGAYIWEAFQRGDSEETITEQLARSTGEDLELVRRDVREFVEALKEKHLLSC
jgi:hypothetical protein